MDRTDQILFGLSQELHSVREPVKIAWTVDQAARELGLPVGITLVSDGTGRGLLPLPTYRGLLERVAGLSERSRETNPLLQGSPLHLEESPSLADLLTGRPLCSHRSLAVLQAQVKPLGRLLEELLAPGSEPAEGVGEELAKVLGLSGLYLLPLGSKPLTGAIVMIIREEPPRWEPSQPGLMERLTLLLGPALREVGSLDSLKGLAKESEAWFKIAQLLARPRLALEKKLDLCLKVILEALQARTGSIMLRRGRSLKVVAATNRRIIGLRQPLDSDSISAHVARTGLLLNLAKVSASGRFKSHPRQYSDYKTDQVLAVPILSGKKVVGVLNITNRLEGKAFIRLEESQAVRFMEQVGGLLDRAVISESLARERARLKTANRELKELQKLKQDLTQMVIHDLKGPLAEIMANLHLLDQDGLSELGAEALESARLGADDLDRLITNLLDVGRLEEGRLALDPRPVSVRTEVGRVIRGLSSLLALHGLEVIMDVEPDLPPAWIHPDFLGRIVQNLLTNAVAHAPGSGRLTCRALVKDGMVQISLADQGPGVKEEHRKTIFDKFSQLPGRIGPRTSTGLGLAFCRLAVEAHGGTIWVQDGPSGGADFRFTLPLAEET